MSDPHTGIDHPGEWELIAPMTWRRWLAEGEYEQLLALLDRFGGALVST